MNPRIWRKTQRQMFLLVSRGHICDPQRDTNMAALYNVYKFGYNAFPNISHMKYRTDPIASVFHFPDSGLSVLTGLHLLYYWWLTVNSETQQCILVTHRQWRKFLQLSADWLAKVKQKWRSWVLFFSTCRFKPKIKRSRSLYQKKKDWGVRPSKLFFLAPPLNIFWCRLLRDSESNLFWQQFPFNDISRL